ncbi:DctP family TRAP transporter solute-binding subunit [Rhizobium oryzicola]|uniref:DctP family TRAP transporter solute-binding subunit n=1 Tax=Rhizobium oryzicola TaxID=1232668 RepID=A0ABT8STI6_9HYPH|nr:DctP family TRAP transporter solute-binding subunit [Rhizobium oryzicola]MDO1581747.1 DctP family TRAP transporter solute-binding subunit [Rhizobium oryzicola]
MSNIRGLNRRTLLAAGTLSFVTSFTGRSHAAVTAPPRVLRIAFTGALTSQMGESAKALAKSFAEASKGQVRIDLYSSGALGGEREITEDLQAGTLDLAVASSAGFAAPTIAPKLGVFDIPFLFRDLNHARATLDGPIGAEALTAMKGTGVVGLAWAENGLRQISSMDKPVRTPADLQGVKIRVPQSEVMVAGFQALGADAQPYSFVELYAALADGTFKAQENPVATIRASNFDKVQKYLSLTGHCYSAAMIMISERVYKTFSPEEQELLRQCAVKAAPLSRAFNDQGQKADIEELARRGMTVVTDVDRAAFTSAMSKVRDKFETLFGKDTLSAIERYKG